MEAAALSTTSRVIVELTDPSNLWNAFEPLLANHLPLRNLHWKSPNRPLRSIDTLHVTTIRAEDGTLDSKQGLRRHQIPGLKQTPYLKIYLLRCDDNETYKETYRKQIRQWIKNNAQVPSTKSSQTSHEKHDAFEWLIVHVVLPDTAAAGQPRTSKHGALGTTESTDSLGSKSKWPGKSFSTLLEKLRADFSSSSKSALDRVAQIRLQKPDAHGHPYSSTPASVEIADQWDDLVEMFKSCILSSFHIRVAQYEEDIRERDSQRHLPGWNFCTFFILKEGLAQGFESVGLLEDASMIYDELAVGLDVVVREQGDEDSGQQGSLLPFSKELKDKIRSALDGLQHGSYEPKSEEETYQNLDTILDLDGSDLPLNTQYKRYREMILANNVSALDFRIYIFTRQIELLYRRVKSDSKVPKNPTSSAVHFECFSTLAEISKRAITFINLAARCMRHDLYNAWGGQAGLDQHDLHIQQLIINNIVSTWAWRAVIQILSDTATSLLSIPNNILTPNAARSIGKGRLSNGDTPEHESGVSMQQVRPDSDAVDDGASEEASLRYQHEESSSEKALNPAPLRPGTRSAAGELAASRAELLLVARKILEGVSLGSKIDHSQNSAQNRHAVNGEAVAGDKVPESTNDSLDRSQNQDDLSFDRRAGLECLCLKRAANSKATFATMYEKLTSLACRHFLAAEKFNSAERTIIELAKWNYNRGDFDTAAKYFEHVSSLNANKSWKVLAQSILGMYADCLRQLHRKEDVVYCFLEILSISCTSNPVPNGYSNGITAVETLVEDLLSASRMLTRSLNVPFDTFFELPSNEPPRCHSDPRHGICLLLSVRSRIPTKLALEDGTSLTLAAVDHNRPTRIRLKLSELSHLGPSSVGLRFVSHEMTLGWYRLETLELRLENLVFTHDFLGDGRSEPYHVDDHVEPNTTQISTLIYPSDNAPIVKAMPSTNIDLSLPRQMLVTIRARSSEMREISLTFRPATAGLRLRLGEAALTVNSERLGISFRSGQTSRINFLPSNSQVALDVPYTMENAEITELEIFVEVSYSTETGTFVYQTLLAVSTILQVSVNVHDVFKAGALFSRFTISPSTLVPLRLRGCRVEGTRHEAVHGADFSKPVDVFPKQPASWLCRFDPSPRSPSSNDSPPKLLIEFECIDEMVLSALEIQFLGDIEASECSSLSTLFCSHLLTTYRSKWTEQDLETACLLHEVEVWSFEDLEWSSVLGGLEKTQRRAAASWLHEWHSRRSSINMGISSAPVRSIGIPIEIPTPRQVISVSLDLKQDAKSPRALAIGQAIPAEVAILHTDRWQPVSSPKWTGTLEITFEVAAPPEIWLIGGCRRGTVDASAREQRFQLILLPQRAGHVMLPSIEVKCFSTSATHGRVEVACETDYKSQAKNVLVIPDLRSTTATLVGGEEFSASGGD